SCWRGFTREIVSLLGMMAVIVLSARVYPHVLRLLEPLTSLTWLRQIIGAGALFLVAIFTYIILVKLVYRLAKATRPSVRQRILGGLVGAIKATVVVAALLILLTRLNPQAATRLTAESKAAPPLFQVAQLMTPLLPADMRTEFRRFYHRNQARIGKYLALPASAAQPNPNAASQANPPGISPSDDQALRRLIRERLREP
ncbi:MAG: CvpA family protein, partial [Candidatus Tectomicrobia bacterium]|nr:CvpA family protein [Candidatus Tectomicrobia bacterium]